MTQAELYNYLTHLMTHNSIPAILDTMADICAKNAEQTETLDPILTNYWDKACGKLVRVCWSIRP